MSGGYQVDTFHGGAGIDTVSYEYSSEDWEVRLLNGNGIASTISASNFGEDKESLVSIENIKFGSGDDIGIGDDGANAIWGFDGNDRLSGGAGNDKLYGGRSGDDLFGGTGDDYIDGGRSADNLFGNQGNDVIIGGLGNDQMFGDEGKDHLTGGDGSDHLTGGIGADTFHFENNKGTDTVTDFSRAEGDLLIFDAIKEFADFDDVLANASMIGGDVVISYGAGTVVIENTDLNQLEVSDFDFV